MLLEAISKDVCAPNRAEMLLRKELHTGRLSIMCLGFTQSRIATCKDFGEVKATPRRCTAPEPPCTATTPRDAPS